MPEAMTASHTSQNITQRKKKETKKLHVGGGGGGGGNCSNKQPHIQIEDLVASPSSPGCYIYIKCPAETALLMHSPVHNIRGLMSCSNTWRPSCSLSSW